MADNPAAVAKNEAAKQAVMLVFAVAGMLILIPIQKRMLEHAAKVMQERADPAAAAQERMQRADQAARRWDRIASYLFDVRIFEGARRAWSQARKARAEYEQARNA